MQLKNVLISPSPMPRTPPHLTHPHPTTHHPVRYIWADTTVEYSNLRYEQQKLQHSICPHGRPLKYNEATSSWLISPWEFRSRNNGVSCIFTMYSLSFWKCYFQVHIYDWQLKALIFMTHWDIFLWILFDIISTLDRTMAWCHQATSYNLSD